MDWVAFQISFQLGLATVAVLLPLGIWIARWLAFSTFRGKAFVETLFALPLVLPPTVLGFYLLVAFGNTSPLGQGWQALTGSNLVFTFEGLLLASIIANLPFAIQPMQRAFEAIPQDIRDAAAVSGLTPFAALRRIELPLAWPGILTGLTLTFAHTLGEFGVVLMVGGSIPGETKTAAIAIYDRVQAFDDRGAGLMAAALLFISLLALGLTAALSRMPGSRRG